MQTGLPGRQGKVSDEGDGDSRYRKGNGLDEIQKQIEVKGNAVNYSTRAMKQNADEVINFAKNWDIGRKTK